MREQCANYVRNIVNRGPFQPTHQIEAGRDEGGLERTVLCCAPARRTPTQKRGGAQRGSLLVFLRPRLGGFNCEMGAYAGGVRVAAVTLGDRDTASYIVILNGAGEVLDHLRLEHLHCRLVGAVHRTDLPSTSPLLNWTIHTRVGLQGERPQCEGTIRTPTRQPGHRVCPFNPPPPRPNARFLWKGRKGRENPVLLPPLTCDCVAAQGVFAPTPT